MEILGSCPMSSVHISTGHPVTYLWRHKSRDTTEKVLGIFRGDVITLGVLIATFVSWSQTNSFLRRHDSDRCWTGTSGSIPHYDADLNWGQVITHLYRCASAFVSFHKGLMFNIYQITVTPDVIWSLTAGSPVQAWWYQRPITFYPRNRICLLRNRDSQQ